MTHFDKLQIQQEENMKIAKKFINLDFVIDVKNYRESFDKWMKIRGRFHGEDQQMKKQLYNKYLRVIKPIIHRFDQVVTKFSNDQYGFYSSNLSNQQIQTLKKVYYPLQEFQIVIEPPANLIENDQLQKQLQKKYAQIYRLDPQQTPKNDELKWWGKGIDIQPIKIVGNVVAGKGQGRKHLGMPTANLQLTVQLEKKLDNYPNGVYMVDFDFVNGKSFRGAGCLGTNPHYQNFQQRRRMEVYVLHDFGDDLFYGSNVAVTLRRLIRFEGKFHTFDAFLQAMHNDIQVARQFCQEHFGQKCE